MDKKIPVGISACLLGERVRFDGGHKRCEFAAQQLAPFCVMNQYARKWQLDCQPHVLHCA